MIHILHLIPALMPGGALRSLAACARSCARREPMRHTVAGLASCPDAAQGCAILREYGLDVLEAPAREDLLKRLAEADLVVAHFWNDPRMYALLQSELPAMRLIVECHVGGGSVPQVLGARAVRLADRLVLHTPLTETAPAVAALDASTRRRKVKVIVEAADLERLKGVVRTPHAGHNITYIGTVDFLKMHPDFVAMSAAIDAPGLHFPVCGPGGDYPTLTRQIAARGLGERFELLGPLSDIRPLLSTTDVFGYPLCPDNYAAGELILQEVAAAGIPAVVFPYGGAGGMILHNFTGYVVHDAQEYAQAVEFLVHHPEERARLGDNARLYAGQIYGAEHAATSMLPLYQGLLAEPKHTRSSLQADPIPVAVTDRLLTETGCQGAWRFVESLGDAAPHFRESLVAGDRERALAADEIIAKESPVVVRNGLFPYRDAYPEDGFLRYWIALTDGEHGDMEAALTGCLTAVRQGCDHWRAFWAIARFAAALGQTDLAREALDRVLAAVPGLARAGELLDTLAADADQPAASLENLRFRRHLYTQAGDLDRAEELAHIVMGSTPDAGDFEAFYLLGVAFHQRGQTDRARDIYARLLADSRTPTHLAAWGHCKRGELLLDDGQGEAARHELAEALRLKPDLTKAAVLIAPADAPLAVRLGEARDDAAIGLDFDPLSGELWTYYFSRRRPDRVSLRLPPETGLREWTLLGRLLVDHLAPGATVHIQGAAGADGLAALERAGLTAEDREAGIFRRAAS